ncbi:hypothetical protein QAD02_005830 [Eretmocerus hayati]|uniref:Uncharacterized protein n=1 Tax=Eretmocerus hayati TaxID=131215 RepID=A0ACC2NUN2_9HYME|nr:hypothetical protein QAD02_005830 [Eretmocerus hayati]
MSNRPVHRSSSKRKLDTEGQKKETKRVKLTDFFSPVRYENKAELQSSAKAEVACTDPGAYANPIRSANIEDKENLVNFANDGDTQYDMKETPCCTTAQNENIQPISIAEGNDLYVASQNSDLDPTLGCEMKKSNVVSSSRNDETKERSLVDVTSCDRQFGHSQMYDVGDYLEKSPDDFMKRNLLSNPWIPPKGYKFPFSEHMKLGKLERRFASHKHLDSYSWLVFSHAKQGYFCKYCSLFVNAGMGGFCKNVLLEKLVTQPLKNFAKVMGATGDLSKHAQTDYHKNSVAAAMDFLNSFANPTKNVVNQISDQRREQVQKNRLHLKSMVENTIFLGRQNIAFRAHRDDGSLDFESGTNQGNFKELLKFRINCGDVELDQRIKSAPANASYTSKTTQNDLIQCCGDEILDTIIPRIKEADFYSPIFDETIDISQISQMTLILRYVYQNTVHEDFVKFVDLFEAARKLNPPGTKTNAELKITGSCLGSIVIQTLKDLGLDPEKCVGITTDGCSVMISETCGAVSVIKQECKNASYSPCHSHMLNLSISKASSVRGVRNAVAHMKSTIGFFKASAKRSDSLKNSLKVALCGLCETRWGERHDGVLQFRELLPTIVSTLDDISLWRDPSTASKAGSLKLSLLDSEFIVSAVCLSDTLTCTRPLSLYFQKKTSM